MRIGIDVGGTNTDAVVMDGDAVVASCKTVTTEDVGSGITAALAEVLAAGQVDKSAIETVMIGTTHFTNCAKRLAATATWWAAATSSMAG